ncbi:MAG: hypothetical protein AAB655_00240, partial [Patescibacteria group bacterium]
MTKTGIGVWVAKVVAVGENARKVLRKIADPRENENPQRHHRNFSSWGVLGGVKKDGLQEFIPLVCKGWIDVQNGERIEIELQDGVKSGRRFERRGVPSPQGRQSENIQVCLRQLG